MQKASELVPSGMLSVIGKPQAQYKYACVQAKEHCKKLGIEEPVCSVANYLFPDGRVIAGHQKVWSVQQLRKCWLKKTLNILVAFSKMQWDNLSKRLFLYINCLIITVLSSRPWISSSKTQEISTLGGPNFSQSAVLSTLSWWRQLLNPWERCSDRWRSVKLKWHSWTCIHLTSMH